MSRLQHCAGHAAIVLAGLASPSCPLGQGQPDAAAGPSVSNARPPLFYNIRRTVVQLCTRHQPAWLPLVGSVSCGSLELEIIVL